MTGPLGAERIDFQQQKQRPAGCGESGHTLRRLVKEVVGPARTVVHQGRRHIKGQQLCVGRCLGLHPGDGRQICLLPLYKEAGQFGSPPAHCPQPDQHQEHKRKLREPPRIRCLLLQPGGDLHDSQCGHNCQRRQVYEREAEVLPGRSGVERDYDPGPAGDQPQAGGCAQAPELPQAGKEKQYEQRAEEVAMGRRERVIEAIGQAVGQLTIGCGKCAPEGIQRRPAIDGQVPGEGQCFSAAAGQKLRPGR